ncbi:MAG TPA: hypothetical protein VEG64_02945 [Candidatus Sulfotelmatobacter sp.]|nr:hypothetical protein [Candidatus Sulfotelmatobacter sp.]
MDLTPQQLKLLERLHSCGFEIVAFPMYAQYIGVSKRGPQVDGESSLGNQSECAALLAPVPSGGFKIYAQPTLLIAGNFTVRITRDGRDYFVWKKESLEATPTRLAALDAFAASLAEALVPAL